MTLESFRIAPFVLCICLALPAGPATAQTIDTDTAPIVDDATPGENSDADTEAPTMAQIEQAWSEGNYVFVRSGLQHLAETEGTALAQYRYGRVLAEGRGGPRDMKAAARWLQKAVDQNNNDAAVLLARIYLSAENQGAAESAATLLARAAARGHPEGQYYNGLLYQSGRGVEQSLEDAFNWFLASAENGYVESQFQVARAYSRGEGTAKSTAEAERWLTEAASNGHIQAQFFLATALDSGNGVTQDRRRALDWYRRAAEAGHLPSQRELGIRYLRGEAATRNVDEGLRWLVSAAKVGDARAQMTLGDVYAGVHDWGVPQNDEQAVFWYRHADAQTYPPGMVALAGMMESGRGIAKNLPAAVDHYRLILRETGYEAAAFRLGELAAEGKLGGLVAPHVAVPWVVLVAERGDDRAIAWLEEQAKGDNRPARTALALLLQEQDGQGERTAELLAEAANSGDVLAQFKLGELYTIGAGVELDYVQAHKWFNIAAALGSSQAAEQRATCRQTDDTGRNCPGAGGCTPVVFPRIRTYPVDRAVRNEGRHRPRLR